MISRHVALVCDKNVKDISFAELTTAAAAFQMQATLHFGPAWGIMATVCAFPSVKDVPVGQWPIVIKEDVPGDDFGYHTDKSRQPYAVLLPTSNWTITASHEVLEMLADPFGNHLIPGPSIRKNDKGRARYLLEVCDPCEDSSYAYSINGVMVSDFILPAYFDPIETKGARYSFTGAITEPRGLLPGGYLSFDDPLSGEMYQAVQDRKGSPKIINLGSSTGRLSLREFSHAQARLRRVPTESPKFSFHPEDSNVKEIEIRRKAAATASAETAARLLRQRALRNGNGVAKRTKR